MIFIVRDDTIKARALAHLAALQYPYRLNVQEGEGRNLDQNACLHGCIADIAAQVEWHGKKLSPEIWKRLLVAAWLREENERPLLIPSLDGNGFDVIYEKTSQLSKAQCGRLITWCESFGAEHGVRFSGAGAAAGGS